MEVTTRPNRDSLCFHYVLDIKSEIYRARGSGFQLISNKKRVIRIIKNEKPILWEKCHRQTDARRFKDC